MLNDARIVAVIPALNEEASIAAVLKSLPDWLDEVIVADNGSTDHTARIAMENGATVVHEPRRGYGAACLRALSAIGHADVVVFLDADNSDDPSEMGQLVEPILREDADLVIGSRALGHAEPGALSLPQRFGNALASFLLSRIYRQPCTDLGPFRAIRWDALRVLRMDDLDYGWTVQMQARAMHQGLRVREVPVRYCKRIGRSKISGTLRGVVGAGYKILVTIAREAMRPAHAVPERTHLLLFTRYPEPGTTKTRMIPALGPDGAANLQREMTRHAVQEARSWARLPGNSFEVRYEGGTPELMRNALGDNCNFTAQGGGDLGARLTRAFADSFAHGHGRVLAMGADCPALDALRLRTATDALHHHDVVLGPSADGGYYLIGLRALHAELFSGISWGTEMVLKETLERCRALALTVHLLPEESDVDTPDDLPVWEAHQCATPRSPEFSVIIPALNEATHLADALASVGHDPATEVIVVDGGSNDDTAAIAEAWGARVIHSPKGRARQMNNGATFARGEILVFLHADSRVPYAFRADIRESLSSLRVLCGAFQLALDDVHPSLRVIETFANWRSQLLQLPYGDQCLFLSAETFHAFGGYETLPVMEDYDLVLRLRKRGRIQVSNAFAVSSARRWLDRGIWRNTLLHWRLIVCWHLGWPPEQLAQLRTQNRLGEPKDKKIDAKGAA